MNVGGIETNKLETNSGGATCWGGVNVLEWKTMECNGRVGLGDELDVGMELRAISKASGLEDDDGEFVGVMVEDELAKLNHGDYMAHIWGWVEDDGLFHVFGFCKFLLSYLDVRVKNIYIYILNGVIACLVR